MFSVFISCYLLKARTTMYLIKGSLKLIKNFVVDYIFKHAITFKRVDYLYFVTPGNGKTNIAYAYTLFLFHVVIPGSPFCCIVIYFSLHVGGNWIFRLNIYMTVSNNSSWNTINPALCISMYFNYSAPFKGGFLLFKNPIDET